VPSLTDPLTPFYHDVKLEVSANSVFQSWCASKKVGGKLRMPVRDVDRVFREPPPRTPCKSLESL